MAIVEQSAHGLNVADIAPFTGVNNGSARLLKAISAAELAGLKEGNIVYVMSVRDYWKWLPNSTIADDGALVTYCKPTVVGVGNGVFERLFICSPDWTFQTTWVFDELNSSGVASNEHDGSTAITPLLNPGEFNNRHNQDTFWKSSTAYHIRFLSAPTVGVIINGFCGTNTVWYVHGTMNDREGVSPPLYTGTVAASDTFSAATNVPWAITSNGLAVDWTGLIDKRLRRTSGASINAIAWVTLQDAVTPKKARTTESYIAPASFNVAPFVPPATTQAAAFVNGVDTFVIEDLRVIPRLEINLHAPPNASITATKVVLDSVSVTSIILSEHCGIYLDGSQVGTNFRRGALTTFHNCKITVLNDDGLKFIIGGYSTTAAGLLLVNNVANSNCSITGWTIQGNSRALFFAGAGSQNSPDTWRIGQIGIYDTTGTQLYCIGQGVRFPSTFLLYGTGNTGAFINVMQNTIPIIQAGIFTAPTVPIVTTSLNQITFVATRTVAPAFDQATGIFTVPRTLSFANIAATVLAGGFDYTFVDPVTGAGFTKY